MQTILTVIQVFLSLGIIGLVLIQHGKGADAGAAFGSGASATVFGSRGSGSFLSRATGVLAALFFMTSIGLAYYAAQGGRPTGLMDGVDPALIEGQPAAVPAAAVPASEVPAVPVPGDATGTDAGVPVVGSAVVPAEPAIAPAVPPMAPSAVPITPAPDAAPTGSSVPEAPVAK